ncbi:hypothetical protein LTR17_016291 [Elasticomyces elasticus]|nr:hypothetical protein LTR17_016291 [Elasticomyces elasticus]
MPHARPFSTSSASHDNPPASNPRTRRAQLRRALDSTTDMADRPRTSLLSPVNRRRQRSRSAQSDDEEPPSEYVLPRERYAPRPSKRRRIDADEATQKLAPIKYGHYGQVEPGRLRLALVSCDGGEHPDPRSPSVYLGAKNILEHNKSVYCSSRPSSNIILRHADEQTPFVLEKLHIVGPEHGFTAPVREGTVHVAMTLAELQCYLPPIWAQRSDFNRSFTPPVRGARTLRRTDSSIERFLRESPEPMIPTSDNFDDQVAQLMREEVSRWNRHRNALPAGSVPPRGARAGSPERLTLTDALRDAEVNRALLERHRREEDPAFRSDGEDDGEPRCELDSDTESSTDPALSRSMGDADERLPITIVSGDEDVGPEEASTQEVLDFRLQRLRIQGRRMGYEQRLAGDRPFWRRVSRPGAAEGDEVEVQDHEPDQYPMVRGLRFAANDGSENTTVSHRRPRVIDDAAERALATGRIERQRETFMNNWVPRSQRGGTDESVVARWDRTTRSAIANSTGATAAESSTSSERIGSVLAEVRRERSRAQELADDLGLQREEIEGLGLRIREHERRVAARATSRASESAVVPPTVPDFGIEALATQARTELLKKDEEAKKVDGVTTAKFRIRKGKHKVSLCFDPPISGRFVLLMLNGGAGKLNVDVQSVILKGYGGGRFFPAREAI